MRKSYVLTFSISVLVLLSVAVIALMLMLPQKVQVVEGNTNKYEGITKSDYTFEQTKDITNEALTKQYTITSEDIENFRKKNQYKPGNADPFSPPDVSSGNNSGNGGSNSSDKTTNSNGGTPNPPSSSK